MSARCVVLRVGALSFLYLVGPAAHAEAQDASAEAPAPSLAPDLEGDGRPRALAGLDEGFGVESADGLRSLRVGGLFSARGDAALPDGRDASVSARLRLARLALSGHLIGPALRYFFQTEFADGARLLDLELTYEPDPALRLRLGRVRAPFARQWDIPLFALQLPDRSVASDFFRPGRDTGVTVESRLFEERLELRAGAYAEDGDRWPKAIARVAFAPLGPMPYDETLARAPGETAVFFGVSVHWDRWIPTEQVVDPMTNRLVTVDLPRRERVAGALDFSLRLGPTHFLVEAFVDRRESRGDPEELGAGGFAQGGVFLVPGAFEASARVDLILPDVEAEGADGLRRYELGVTGYFLDAHLKVQGRYAYDAIVGDGSGLSRVEGHSIDAQFVLAI